MSKLWFRPVFVCPKCGFESFEASAIRCNYCERCRLFFDEASQPERSLDTPNPNIPKGKPLTSIV
jgi:hypothetical protein